MICETGAHVGPVSHFTHELMIVEGATITTFIYTYHATMMSSRSHSLLLNLHLPRLDQPQVSDTMRRTKCGQWGYDLHGRYRQCERSGRIALIRSRSRHSKAATVVINKIFATRSVACRQLPGVSSSCRSSTLSSALLQTVLIQLMSSILLLPIKSRPY